MKSLSRVVLVLAVVNLATAGLAAEQEDAQRDVDQEGETQRQVLAAALQGEFSKIEEQDQITAMEELAGLARGRPELAQLFQEIPLFRRMISGAGGGRVLVIPEDQVDAAKYMAIMEDMTIMAGIFDRKLKEEDLSEEYDWYRDSGLFEWTVPVTRGIYLGGYGALFLKKVDFPLLAPDEAEEKKEEAEEEEDAVWQQAKREMYFGSDISRGTRDRRQRKTKEYDARKVETLKGALLESLRHASNIRNLSPEDLIIVSVVSEGGSGQVLETSKVYMSGDEKIVTTSVRRGLKMPGVPEELGWSPGAVITMRVKKSDVDSLAEGEIIFDEFCEKVQTILTPAGGYGGGSYPGGYGGGYGASYGGGKARR